MPLSGKHVGSKVTRKVETNAVCEEHFASDNVVFTIYL